MTTPPHSESPAIQHHMIGFGPRTAAVVGGCALVFTAYALGARWLGEQALMLPVGVWVVGAVWLVAHAVVRGAFSSRGVVRSVEHCASAAARELAGTSFVPASGTAHANPLIRNSARVLKRTGRAVERMGRRARAGKGEITIGLDMPAAEAAQVILAAGEPTLAGAAVRFERAEPGLVKNGPDDAAEFDALLRRGQDNRLYLFVHAREGAPSAWADWSQPADAGFASVFPLRLDTAKAKLGDVDLMRDDLSGLTARLVITAAALGRIPARAGTSRGFASRRSLANFSGATSAAIAALADALLAVRPEGAERASGLCRSAARVVSANVAGAQSQLAAADRLHLATAAGAFLDNEVESLLRLGALRIASGQAEPGLAALTEAAEQLRRGGVVCKTDPMPFVLAEAELAAQSGDDRLSLGRLCAGVALLCGTASPRALEYIRDDLTDDLDRAGWTAARPGDAALLRMLLAQLGAASSPQAGAEQSRGLASPRPLRAAA